MVGRKRTRGPRTETPILTVHQIVAYNFARARQHAGWTQAETGERLEPYLGYRLNQAGISAIEKTYDTERRRNIDAAEIVAFARCFNRPIVWFFLPPTGHGRDLVEPVHADGPYQLPAAELIAHTIGTPAGWRSFLARIAELLDTDRRPVADAVNYALDGRHDPDDLETQLDLRRQAIREITLARHATPADDVITDMARLLVELVKLTPLGFAKLRDTDPDQALTLLAEAEGHLDTHLAAAAERRREGRPSSGGFDDIQPIDLEAVMTPTPDEDTDTQ